MPLPPVQTLPQLQTGFINGFASALNPAFGVVAANIPVGDPAQALAFATAGVAVYLQAQIQGLVNYSRASTATGTSLDSWLADFNFERPGGGTAQGWISIPTSTGANATTPIPIPINQLFQTAPIVVSPSTVPTVYYFWTTTAATIAVGQNSVKAPYIAVTAQGAPAPGALYNNIPSTAQLQFSSGLVGVGTPVFSLPPGYSTGPVGPAGGTNAASDPQARADFVTYIDSLAGSIASALIAGIEGVSSYLVEGQTFVLWDYATAPNNNPQLVWPGQAVCIFVSTNPDNTGQYKGPYGTDPLADGILRAMNGTIQNPTEGVGFSVTPLVYYANTYLLTTLVIGHMWVSQSALANAGLSLTELQSNLQGLLQDLIGLPQLPGLGLSQGIAWSTIIAALKDYSVVQPSGAVVTGIVTDVTPFSVTGHVLTPAMSTIDYTSASDGGPVPSTSHQTTVEGTGDPSGVLRWSSSLNVTWTTVTYVP